MNQGEVDEALLKAANNTAGILFHYPAGQIGATVDGIVTMANGKTRTPARSSWARTKSERCT
jgi:hypothetical protein